MNRFLLYATLLYSITAGAALTLPDKAELGNPTNYILNGGFERGAATVTKYNDSLAVTITTANPAVFTTTAAHGLQLGDGVVVQSSATLPTGLTANTVYYVVLVPSTTTFQVSASRGGTAVATTAAGSGTYSASPIRPLDAVAGTTSHLTIATSNTAPLQGARSLIITNSGSTPATGEGFALPLAVDAVDRGVIMNLSFSYQVQSGTFQIGSVGGATIVDSDLEPFLYDVTNGLIVPVTPTLLQCGGIATKCDFTGQFVLPSNSANLRLAFHVVTPNALAWAVKFDAFNASRVVRNGGFNATEQIPFTPVITSTTGTNPTPPATFTRNLAYYERYGSLMHIHLHQNWSVAGAVGSGCYALQIPGGFTADVIKRARAQGPEANAADVLGIAKTQDSSNNGHGHPLLYDANRIQFNLKFSANSASGSVTDQCWGAPAFGYANANTAFSTDIWVPIAGWSAGSSTSDQSPSVPVYFSVYRNAAFAITTGISTVAFDTVQADTHAGYSTAGTYTFKVPGWYHCDNRVSINSTNPTSYLNGYLYLDNTSICTDYTTNTTASATHAKCSRDFYANVGQVLSTRALAQFNNGILVGQDMNYMSCHKTNQGLGITAADPEIAILTLTTGYSIAANANIKYDTVARDTLSGYDKTTGLQTIKIGGTYSVQLTVASSANYSAYFKINGVGAGILYQAPTGNGQTNSAGRSFYIPPNSQVSVVLDVAGNLAGSSAIGAANSLSIVRTGP